MPKPKSKLMLEPMPKAKAKTNECYKTDKRVSGGKTEEQGKALCTGLSPNQLASRAPQSPIERHCQGDRECRVGSLAPAAMWSDPVCGFLPPIVCR
jgi:hypothetical protein